MLYWSEKRAENYIKDGVFPKEYEIEKINEVREIFSRQRYWAIVKWLFMKDTSQNASRLFKMIFSKYEVNHVMYDAILLRACKEMKDEGCIEQEMENCDFDLFGLHKYFENGMRKMLDSRD